MSQACPVPFGLHPFLLLYQQQITEDVLNPAVIDKDAEGQWSQDERNF